MRRMPSRCRGRSSGGAEHLRAWRGRGAGAPRWWSPRRRPRLPSSRGGPRAVAFLLDRADERLDVGVALDPRRAGAQVDGGAGDAGDALECVLDGRLAVRAGHAFDDELVHLRLLGFTPPQGGGMWLV